jgi:hypothetical protein
MPGQGILALRFDVSPADLDRVELVAADAPAEDLLPSGGRVEGPLAVLLDDRDRHRPVSRSHRQHGDGLRGVELEPLFLSCLRREGGSGPAVLHGVFGLHQVGALAAQDGLQGRDVELLGRNDQRGGRALRSGELPGRGRVGWGR